MNEPICGVYAIICKEEWTVYIGSSEDIEERWNQHRTAFRKGSHVSEKFRKAWRRQGEDSIEFVVLEEVCLHEMKRIEMLFILAARSIKHLTVSNSNASWTKPIKVESKQVQTRAFDIQKYFPITVETSLTA